MHPKEVGFVQSRALSGRLSSLLDSSGIDFVVAFNPLSLHADWQIKISANGKTKAVVMPPRENFPENLLEGLTPRMRNKILRDVLRHERRHPRCFLFVGKVNSDKSREEILDDIWKEIVDAFKVIKSRQGR